MTLAALIQLLASCIGIVGSLFFAIGVIRQNAAAMARLSYTYWDANPHLPGVLAAQKADYVFGGGLIVVAFALQLASFFSTDPALVLIGNSASFAPWVALGGTIAAFLVFRVASTWLANYYQEQVRAVIHEQNEEDERERREKLEKRKNAS